MGWDAVVERFLKRSPLTVMAHLTLRRALAAPWLDALFGQHAERQYVRSLLFSTVVDLLASVTFGFRPSIHAAVKAAGATLPVSLTALYDKINRTEPALVRAMVREGAQRLAGVLAALTPPPPAEGACGLFGSPADRHRLALRFHCRSRLPILTQRIDRGTMGDHR